MTRLLVYALAAALASPPSIDPGVEHLSAERMRADVTFLASKELAGRVSGSAGAKDAAEFLAGEMQKAGVQTVPGEASHFQTFPLVEFDVDLNESALGWKLEHQPGVETTFRPAANFLCRYPEPVSITAGVVFAGYGITAPELGYDDYAGIDVRGKFVLVVAGEPQREKADSIFGGRGDTIYAGMHSKQLNAEKHGAAALLVAAPYNSARVRVTSDDLVEPQVPVQALPRASTDIPVVSLAAHVADDLFQAVRQERADLETRIDAALKPQSFTLNGIVMTLEHRLQFSRPVSSANVTGWLEGADPKLKEDAIVIAAHYDHLGSAGDKYFPGANDNASGSAAVLELARSLAASRIRPRRSILFIVFGSEEEGTLGSLYYVRHPLRPLERTVAVLDLDMIGRSETPGPETQGRWHVPADTANSLDPVGTQYSPELRHLLEAANRRVGLKLDFRLDADHSLDVLQRCDHYPFALAHIPSVWLFGGFHPEYHQITDTADRLNYSKMLKVAQLTMRLAWEMANQEARPRFVLRLPPVKEIA
jgi:hypothetical protein